MSTLTLDTLPESGTLRVYVTAERHTEESLEFGDAAERGWVREPFNRDIYEARNDVAPWMEFPLPLTDDDRDEIASAVDNLGHIDSAERGTLYLGGMHEDDETGDSFTFNVHTHVKHHDGTRGWVETDVHILPPKFIGLWHSGGSGAFEGWATDALAFDSLEHATSWVRERVAGRGPVARVVNWDEPEETGSPVARATVGHEDHPALGLVEEGATLALAPWGASLTTLEEDEHIVRTHTVTVGARGTVSVVR